MNEETLDIIIGLEEEEGLSFFLFHKKKQKKKTKNENENEKNTKKHKQKIMYLDFDRPTDRPTRVQKNSLV